MSDGRFLVTGVDAAGRSCAAQNDEVSLQPALEGLRYSMMYRAPGPDGSGQPLQIESRGSRILLESRAHRR